MLRPFPEMFQEKARVATLVVATPRNMIPRSLLCSSKGIWPVGRHSWRSAFDPSLWEGKWVPNPGAGSRVVQRLGRERKRSFAGESGSLSLPPPSLSAAGAGLAGPANGVPGAAPAPHGLLLGGPGEPGQAPGQPLQALGRQGPACPPVCSRQYAPAEALGPQHLQQEEWVLWLSHRLSIRPIHTGRIPAKFSRKVRDGKIQKSDGAR